MGGSASMQREAASRQPWLGAALVGAVCLLLAAIPAGAQEKITLKLAHGFPPGHPAVADFVQPWARDLEKRSGQRLQVSLHDSASALGNPAGLLERLTAGEADIVHGMQGAYPGRFPRTHLLELPFTSDSSGGATRALWTMRDRQLKAEYAGLKVLALHAHNGGVIHTSTKKVMVPGDLKGLRLRSPSTAVNRTLSAYGATSLGMPPGQAQVNLRAGLMDGALFSWEGASIHRIAEATRYHLDTRMFVTPYFFVMSQKRYQALPAEVRKAIDESSGAALVARFSEWWDRWEQPAMAAARKRGDAVVTLSPAQREAWAVMATPANDRYLAEVAKAGVGDARAVHAEMKKLAKAVGAK